ncbi:MAG: circularly permuted type 2 ATP-grasp protein, partial [Pseudomonadota bacterium]
MTLPAELDPALADLLAPYAAREADAPYDEALGPDGAVRAHWADLLDWTGRAGTAGYAAVTAETRRLRIESGVAFDPSGDEISSAGADAFPVVIEPSEWERLAEGIAQRARLIEAALADIYGPRALLREGLLPPGLIYGNPDFAQWLRTPQAPPGPWLTLYEMDLARGADGRWVAISDRSDAPLGDGWLIANRVASSQSFAEPFLAGRIRRLAAHYEDTQAYLEEAAGPDGRMALLSGGARHGRYFSHAYFARYLGAAMIEPADLTVRGGDAFVKTIDGLQPLALLLRGERDRKLDALFAPDHAAPGAPALSLAARSGRLKLANALGASALAYRAIAPYARQAARRLIGEELFLDDAPCLWLGDPAAREQVMDEPEFWRVEHVSRGPLEPDAPSLYAKDRDALARRLAREGDRWAAVATPRLATAPVWKDGALAPRPWIMRVFASRTPEGWSVAPGGVASAVEQGRAPPPLGFGKDVWVPARNDEEAKSAPSLDRRLAGAHLRRTGGDLLSRVADDLFWLGRGAVRAETTLRVLHLAIERMLSARDEDGGPEILAAILEIQATPNEARTGMAGVRDAVARLSADLHEPLGMPMLLNRLRGAGQRARPYLSEESWRSLDRLTSDRGWRRPPPAGAAAALLRLIDDSLMSLAAFAGTTAENLTRNHVWRFLELGRSVERSLGFSRAAERLAGRRGSPDEPWLRAWLTLADSRTAYRTRYLTVPAAAPAIDLLILDENNPRSLVHQLARIERALDRLP